MTEELVSGVPQPKYGVGSTFWVARVDVVEKQLPCPDCLGTRVWKAVSPAGVEHELSCPRCGSGYYTGSERIPSLRYAESVGRAELFTVRGMDIRSHSFDRGGHDCRVSYYSGEHGGSVFHEHQAHDREESALAAAHLLAAEANAKAQATPQALVQRHFSHVTFRDAAMEAANKTAQDAWWAYTFLKEDVAAAIENDGAGYRDLTDICAELQRHLDFDLKHRQQYRPPSQVPLYDALEAVLAAFRDVADEHLPYLVAEEVTKRVAEARRTVIAARAAIREFMRPPGTGEE